MFSISLYATSLHWFIFDIEWTKHDIARTTLLIAGQKDMDRQSDEKLKQDSYANRK